jgi:malate dehydrogenase (oxaloacetate-decarboxylating)(NADP+)
MLKLAGARHVVLCDSKGVVRRARGGLTGKKLEHAADTSAETVGDAMRGAHVFVGVSVANCIRPEDVKGMASYPAVMAMSNPDPEIRPEAVAAALGDRPYVMATGRSDYANQVNNVLGFPFIFRGALDAGARSITMEMKMAASRALADLARREVPEEVRALYGAPELAFGPGYVIPKPFDRRLFVEIPLAVALAAGGKGAAGKLDAATYRAALERRNATRGGIG